MIESGSSSERPSSSRPKATKRLQRKRPRNSDASFVLSPPKKSTPSKNANYSSQASSKGQSGRPERIPDSGSESDLPTSWEVIQRKKSSKKTPSSSQTKPPSNSTASGSRTKATSKKTKPKIHPPHTRALLLQSIEFTDSETDTPHRPAIRPPKRRKTSHTKPPEHVVLCLSETEDDTPYRSTQKSHPSASSSQVIEITDDEIEIETPWGQGPCYNEPLMANPCSSESTARAPSLLRESSVPVDMPASPVFTRSLQASDTIVSDIDRLSHYNTATISTLAFARATYRTATQFELLMTPDGPSFPPGENARVLKELIASAFACAALREGPVHVPWKLIPGAATQRTPQRPSASAGVEEENITQRAHRQIHNAAEDISNSEVSDSMSIGRKALKRAPEDVLGQGSSSDRLNECEPMVQSPALGPLDATITETPNEIPLLIHSPCTSQQSSQPTTTRSSVPRILPSLSTSSSSSLPSSPELVTPTTSVTGLSLTSVGAMVPSKAYVNDNWSDDDGSLDLAYPD